MTVYKKLQEARVRLHKTKLNKSGENKFARFHYFELGDFIPQVTEIFNEVGLCGVISFTPDAGYLHIHDVETDKYITFMTPMVMANMDKVQAIQNLGSTHTYMRRYLWLLAMDITENDVVDAVEPKSEPKSKPEPKTETKPDPKVETKPVLSGQEGAWRITVDTNGENWAEAVKEGTNLLLGLVTDKLHVNEIYKKNRIIFDKLKEVNEATYDEIMGLFKTTKEKWSK
jgi:hypothetical protein